MTRDTRTRPRLLLIAAGAIAVAAIISVAAVIVLSSSDRPSAEADRLFASTQRCDTTLADHAIEVTFPAEWWTNEAIPEWPPCVWFAPDPLDVSTAPPEGVAIVLGSVGGPPMPFQGASSVISREALEVARRPALRVEKSREPSADEGEATDLTYWVSLVSPEGGPTLVATTSSDSAGDYLLNKAVLDRMMATLVIEPRPDSS